MMLYKGVRGVTFFCKESHKHLINRLVTVKQSLLKVTVGF